MLVILAPAAAAVVAAHTHPTHPTVNVNLHLAIQNK